MLSWSSTILASSANMWARALSTVIIIAALLRSRAFPLRSEVLSLWLAAVPPALVLSGAITQPAARAALLFVAGLVLASLSLYRPAPQTRVRLRRLGDRLESLCLAATLPLLCGIGGLFTHLLGVFA